MIMLYLTKFLLEQKQIDNSEVSKIQLEHAEQHGVIVECMRIEHLAQVELNVHNSIL